MLFIFFFQAEDGIRVFHVTGVQTCAIPIFIAGSFFEAVPPADVYILGTILHDWDDEHATKILRTIRAAASDDSRLLLLEGVVRPGNEPDGAKWLDLLMLTLFAGRERDEAQWRELLERGGWRAERFGEGLIEARCR